MCITPYATFDMINIALTLHAAGVNFSDKAKHHQLYDFSNFATANLEHGFGAAGESVRQAWQEEMATALSEALYLTNLHPHNKPEEAIKVLDSWIAQAKADGDDEKLASCEPLRKQLKEMETLSPEHRDVRDNIIKSASAKFTDRLRSQQNSPPPEPEKEPEPMPNPSDSKKEGTRVLFRLAGQDVTAGTFIRSAAAAIGAISSGAVASYFNIPVTGPALLGGQVGYRVTNGGRAPQLTEKGENPVRTYQNAGIAAALALTAADTAAYFGNFNLLPRLGTDALAALAGFGLVAHKTLNGLASLSTVGLLKYTFNHPSMVKKISLVSLGLATAAGIALYAHSYSPLVQDTGTALGNWAVNKGVVSPDSMPAAGIKNWAVPLAAGIGITVLSAMAISATLELGKKLKVPATIGAAVAGFVYFCPQGGLDIFDWTRNWATNFASYHTSAGLAPFALPATLGLGILAGGASRGIFWKLANLALITTVAAGAFYIVGRVATPAGEVFNQPELKTFGDTAQNDSKAVLDKSAQIYQEAKNAGAAASGQSIISPQPTQAGQNVDRCDLQVVITDQNGNPLRKPILHVKDMKLLPSSAPNNSYVLVDIKAGPERGSSAWVNKNDFSRSKPNCS